MTVSLSATITALTRADSRIPATSIPVRASTIRMAGRFTTAVTGPRRGGHDRARRCRQRRRKGRAEVVQQARQVPRPAHRDGRRRQRVLEHQVPADDPRHEFAHRGVGIGVGAAGDGNGGGELGIAETGECAGQACQPHGQDDGRTRVCTGDLAGEHEDAGADDRADAERQQVATAQHARQRGSLVSVGTGVQASERDGDEERHVSSSGSAATGSAAVTWRPGGGRRRAARDTRPASVPCVEAACPSARGQVLKIAARCAQVALKT